MTIRFAVWVNFSAIPRSRQNQQKYSPFAALYFCGYFVKLCRQTKYQAQQWMMIIANLLHICCVRLCMCESVCTVYWYCLCNAECSPMRSLTSFHSFSDLTFLLVAYTFLRRSLRLLGVCERMNDCIRAHMHITHVCTFEWVCVCVWTLNLFIHFKF